MSRLTIEKLAVSVILVAWYLLMPQVGYTDNMESPAHITYMLSHGNIWHLAGNVFVLWLMRDKLWLISALLIAMLCSFMPVVGTIWSGFAVEGPTMGFSGVLFAIFGIKWGFHTRYCYGKKCKEAIKAFMTKVLPFALVGVLIPHINWCIHLYCLLAGFVYGRCRR